MVVAEQISCRLVFNENRVSIMCILSHVFDLQILLHIKMHIKIHSICSALNLFCDPSFPKQS